LKAQSCFRNSYEDDSCIFKPVNDFALFAGFSCGRDDLDDYVQNDAHQHDQEMLSRTYSFHIKNEDGNVSAPVAFVSLANDAVRLSNRKKAKVFPPGLQYRVYPAVKICRLGSHQECQRKGIGSYLLWALKTLFLSENRTGCRFVTVDAYNDQGTLGFYQKNDFEFQNKEDVEASTRILFYDLMRFKESVVNS